MGIEAIEKFVHPVSEEIRSLISHDTNDRWLVEEIGFSSRAYKNATHVLIGCPQDEGVRRNNGRVGAAQAPDKIRECLYRFQVPEKQQFRLFDAGNINTDYFDFTDTELLDETSDITKETSEYDLLERAHQNLMASVRQFLKDGKKVVVLGGGNDISYADVRALSETYGEISAINIDAHLDMRIADEMTSGTPYMRLIEEGFLEPPHFHEFGIRSESNAAYYIKTAQDMGVNVHYLQKILADGAAPAFKKILENLEDQPLFLGLDMDSIQASDAPGVSASSPIGFSGREILQIIKLVKENENLKVFEITEMNPLFDLDGRTAKLAAQFVYEFLT